MNSLQIATQAGFVPTSKALAQQFGLIASCVFSEIAALKEYHQVETVYTTLKHLGNVLALSEYHLRKALRTLQEAGIIEMRLGRNCIYFTVNNARLAQYTNVTVTPPVEHKPQSKSATEPLPFTYSSTSKTVPPVTPPVEQYVQSEECKIYTDDFKNFSPTTEKFSVPFKEKEYKKKEEEKERGETVVKGKPLPTQFTPPNLGDILIFAEGIAREHGKKTAPKIVQRFYNYYQANGWHMGRGLKIRDWKALFSVWVEREEEIYNPQLQKQVTRKPNNESNYRVHSDEERLANMERTKALLDGITFNFR